MNRRRRRFLGAVAGAATAGLVGVTGYARRSNAGSAVARTQGGTVLMSARQGNVYDPVGLSVEPGATVTITATLNGEPVVGADVYVRDGDDERQLVGQTDENGQLQVTVPAEGDNAGELDVQVRQGELEGELEVG